jgi:hypothetical protein
MAAMNVRRLIDDLRIASLRLSRTKPQQAAATREDAPG